MAIIGMKPSRGKLPACNAHCSGYAGYNIKVVDLYHFEKIINLK